MLTKNDFSGMGLPGWAYFSLISSGFFATMYGLLVLALNRWAHAKDIGLFAWVAGKLFEEIATGQSVFFFGVFHAAISLFFWSSLPSGELQRKSI